ncbi:MAG: glucosamine-6-phosphate deaminase [Cyclobacteriaceae bacterium]|nr:glucosamine-6-phosphate deaminase [Cyclobacteriaceae bacterium]
MPEILIKHSPLGLREELRFEKIHTVIFPKAYEGSMQVAREIAALIKEKEAHNKPCVLGLATGSSPTTVYNELVRMHKEEGLSFKNVHTFNLDEYYPMQPNSLQSYVRFMDEFLFNHIDIDRANIHIPDGTLQTEEVFDFCQQYEQQITNLGGLDLQVLGIGRTGHIGFNEPGSHPNSGTRMVTLDHITRVDAADDFIEIDNVPRKAITMGVGSIMKAKRVILMAWGEGKASIIAKTIEGKQNDLVPATFLQNHANVTFVLDEAASAKLTRVNTPWLVASCTWSEYQIKRAVVWLCQKTGKPILKLTDRDYNDNGMSDLVSAYGSSYEINIKMFNQLQHTITGWPGGKPNADDTNRPERAEPAHKRVVIFSPHPDDDVISMGGTFIRLHDQGHEVHVGYQTSGNIAVFDDEVIRFADFNKELNKFLGVEGVGTSDLYEKVKKEIADKQLGEQDSTEVREIKSLIREGEAKAACRFVGLPESRMHFLNMPFYETGKVKKDPFGSKDVKVLVDFLRKIKPHQIYAAGDLSDPHGTHRVCLDAIFAAIKEMKNDYWMQECYVWLYRGAWQEWGIEDIDMTVPLSPDELRKKRKAIFKHQSQKDSAVFPGNDAREFWQRSEDRNTDTAKQYDKLGLAEYEAMEAFKRYKF